MWFWRPFFVFLISKWRTPNIEFYPTDSDSAQTNYVKTGGTKNIDIKFNFSYFNPGQNCPTQQYFHISFLRHKWSHIWFLHKDIYLKLKYEYTYKPIYVSVPDEPDQCFFCNIPKYFTMVQKGLAHHFRPAVAQWHPQYSYFWDSYLKQLLLKY